MRRVGAWCIRAFITVMEEKWRERQLHGNLCGTCKRIAAGIAGDQCSFELLWWRASDILSLFCQSSVSAPLAPVNVFPLTGFISFPDKWHQMRRKRTQKKEKRKKKNFSHTLGSDELMFLPTSTLFFFQAGDTKCASFVLSLSPSPDHLTHVECAGIISSHENWLKAIRQRFMTRRLFITDVL